MTKSKTELEVEERFGRDTASHKLTILHDDGLYRHLHFKRPGDSAYWFELITTPGSLTFQGDGTAYTFRRLRDMFQFFRSNPDRLTHRINPHYWAEKVVSHHGPGYSCLQEYSETHFQELVAEALSEAEVEHPGVTAAWTAETTGFWPDWDVHVEEGAREALRDFSHGEFTFGETWEWDLRDWHWWYLWACHAIVWGIAQYDAEHTRRRETAVRAEAALVANSVST